MPLAQPASQPRKSQFPRQQAGSGIELAEHIIELSNFNGAHPSAVGSHHGIGPYAHGEVGNFLGGPPPDTIDQPATEKPGTMIGPYKLLQEIGQGGFGVVYMAEQQQPVQRKVALKVIKPGMDTREVIARFEAERQALAMMDHPNIARVLGCWSNRIRATLLCDGAGSWHPRHGLLRPE